MTWMEDWEPPPWYKRWRYWPILRWFFGFKFKWYETPRVYAKWPEFDREAFLNTQPMIDRDGEER